jgi:hypothetical protein
LIGIETFWRILKILMFAQFLRLLVKDLNCAGSKADLIGLDGSFTDGSVGLSL